MESRSFASALAFLAGRNRQRATKVVEVNLPEANLPSGRFAGRGKPPLLGMREWLRQLGYTDKVINCLNIIHVAGTKGKGSTCAIVESFLRTHGKTNHHPYKTGLYTSPHLFSVTERIRINFEPLPDETFAKYVFEVRDALHLKHQSNGPGFLQLLAIISFHAFLREGVNVAIYETHHGGEYCATNVIQSPVVTAITTIGLDHIIDLGPGVEDIAWHKAGILKPGAIAFTVPQDDSVSAVLERRAADIGVPLHTVGIDPHLPVEFDSDVQRLNCSLARAIADEFLRKVSPGGLPCQLSAEDIVHGIRQYQWPGRFQTIPDDECTWFVDVAHNEMSMVEVARWYDMARMGSSSVRHVGRVLIYGHKPTHKRDAKKILRQLAQSLQLPIDLVIFTSPEPIEEGFSDVDRDTLEQYSQIWKDVKSENDCTVLQAPTFAQATKIAKEHGDRLNKHVLVTGCHEIVAGVLSELGRQAKVKGAEAQPLFLKKHLIC